VRKLDCAAMKIAVSTFAFACACCSLAACGGGSSSQGSNAVVPGGTLFGSAFVIRDALLVHPQSWKSAAPGSTALLFSDTAGLCAQITSGKTTAPGRLLIVRLEQRDASAAVVALTPGTFTRSGEGTPSSRFADVYGSAVDANCVFSKAFAGTVQAIVTAAGATLDGSLDAHLTNGDAQTGAFSVSATCDETAVDAWLNKSPTCG
jgi:hypothetical protein